MEYIQQVYELLKNHQGPIVIKVPTEQSDMRQSFAYTVGRWIFEYKPELIAFDDSVDDAEKLLQNIVSGKLETYMSRKFNDSEQYLKIAHIINKSTFPTVQVKNSKLKCQT